MNFVSNFSEKLLSCSTSLFGMTLSVRDRECVCVCVYPLLGGLVAEVQGGGVPVHSNISIPYRGSVLCTLYCAASTEPGNTHR